MTQVDGIKPGRVVADSSFDKLQDNARVTVVSKPTPAAAGRQRQQQWQQEQRAVTHEERPRTP